MKISGERVAQIGIGVQFLALIRTLGEYFRLKHFAGHPLTIAMVEPYITGALVASVCAAVSVTLYFFGKYKAAVVTSCAAVAILLALKLVLIR